LREMTRTGSADRVEWVRMIPNRNRGRRGIMDLDVFDGKVYPFEG
jgi:ribosomal protein L13